MADVGRLLCVRCSGNGTFLSQLLQFDDDPDPFRFTLVNDSSGPFSMNSSGYLRMDTSKGALNFEERSTYVLTVSLQETSNQLGSALLFASQGNLTITITVLDVNEFPYFVGVPSGYRIDEESANPNVTTAMVAGVNGTFIIVGDQDFGNDSALTVTTVSGALGYGSSYFEVVTAGGDVCRGAQQCVLRVRSGSPRMNFDAGLRTINVTLNVSDSTGRSTLTPMFNVTVNDINQGACVLLKHSIAEPFNCRKGNPLWPDV